MIPLSKQHFWAWFSRHNDEYLDFKKKSKKDFKYWLNELNAHLRAYCKSFYFAIGCDEEASVLIITANGNAKQFKKIEDFVAKAPPLAGWKFIALEGPRPIDFLLQSQIEESGIDPTELLFSFDIDSANRVYLTMYHPLCNMENEELIFELGSRAVYNLLGERSFGLDIRKIRVANLSEAASGSVAKLEQLPACLGRSKSGMEINADGNLIDRFDC